MTHTPERWEADESGLYVFAYDSAGRACVAVEIRGWGVLSNKFGEEKAIEIQKERAHRFAALWNMAERLGLSTEEIDGRKIDHALYKLEELELMVERGDLQ